MSVAGVRLMKATGCAGWTFVPVPGRVRWPTLEQPAYVPVERPRTDNGVRPRHPDRMDIRQLIHADAVQQTAGARAGTAGIGTVKQELVLADEPCERVQSHHQPDRVARTIWHDADVRWVDSILDATRPRVRPSEVCARQVGHLLEELGTPVAPHQVRQGSLTAGGGGARGLEPRQAEWVRRNAPGK